MSVEEGNIEPQQVSSADLGRIRKERYLRGFDVSVEQAKGIAKWLAASLFAINSGGIVTVLYASDDLPILALPATLFGCGLIFAILSGGALQETYNRRLEPLTDMIDYWAEIEAGAPQDSDRHGQIQRRIKNVQKWFWAARIFGWSSGAMFILGALSVAFGVAGMY